MTFNPQTRTLAERMRQAMPGMSPGERRIVRYFLSVAAPESLATVSALADTAGVSAPTVLRALSKIGFDHFSDFRSSALNELAEKHESALDQTAHKTEGGEGHVAAIGETLAAAVRDTFDRLDAGELATALDLIGDQKLRQIITGGRFSHSVAEQLYGHVNLIRPGVELLSYSGHGRAARLVDVGRSHVVTVFDFRRYQRDTVELAYAARRKRARIVLVTDQWMSPIADWADAVLVAEVRSASPFDSLVPALALVEMMISVLHARLGTAASARLTQFESTDESFEWNGFDTPDNGIGLSIDQPGDNTND